VGDHHRDDGNDPEHEFERDIGAGIQVGQKQGQDGGNKGGPHGEYDRIDNDAGEIGVGVRSDVLFQGEGAEGAQPLGEASKHQHDDGAYRQKPDNRNQARRQRRSRIKHRPVHFESTKQ